MAEELATSELPSEAVPEPVRPAPEADIPLLRIDAVVKQFTGPISQVPPMHSALKKDGKALYEYARKGEDVERCDAAEVNPIDFIEGKLAQTFFVDEQGAEKPVLLHGLDFDDGLYFFNR